MGSNQEDCKIIAEEINKYITKPNETECFDLTVGGANILDKIECKTLWGYDISPTLIALHQAMQKDPHMIMQKQFFNKETWDECYKHYKLLNKQKGPTRPIEDYAHYVVNHNLHPLHRIGACEWYGSFGHGGFSQGMAPQGKRNYFEEARNNHLEQLLTTNYPYINFRVKDYAFVNVPPQAIIIAHINSPKNYQWCGKFDKFKFYKWAVMKSKTNPIFIIDDLPLIDIKQLKNLKSGNLYFMGKL
jgi:hypothetical protein